MGRLRKLGVGLVCLSLIAAMLAGCGSRQEPEITEELRVYATFYPIYAVASMITENVPNLYLNCLAQPQDGCLRSYALSDWDAALLGSADAVLMGGQGLERFEGAILSLGENQLAVSEALYNVELARYTPENTDADGESHWLDANPHIYMSIDGAIEIAGRIAQSMAVFDPRYEDLYSENLASAEEKLGTLKEEIAGEIAGISGEPAAVLNEALVYAARDYGLDIALCWDRESGESMDESAFKELLAALEKNGTRVVLIEKQAPKSLCEALERAGVAGAALDVLSTRRADEGYEGYFAAQRANAAAVRQAYLSISEDNA